MSNIKLFSYRAKQVRTMSIDGEIWFASRDVCEVLEIVNARDAASRLPNHRTEVQ